MGELVRVAHDAHGLDPAVDDVHREDVPDPERALVPGRGPDAADTVGELSAHDRGEALRVGGTGLQERLYLLDRAPLGLAVLLRARTAQHAAGLAVDPHQLRLE